MITILTHDSRIFYAEDNDSLFAYTDKKLTQNKHYRVKNVVKFDEVTAGTRLSIYNFNALKEVFPNLPEYGREYIFPDNVADQPFKVVENGSKKELYYIESLVGVTEQLYRKIDDKWLPKTIATLYTVEEFSAVEYVGTKQEIYLDSKLITNTGERFFKYAYSDDDSTVFIYYREDDKNLANPYYYVNKMVNYNNETGLWDFVAPNVFPGFTDPDLDEDSLVKIMANNTRNVHYFVPTKNIDKMEVLKFNSDILIFIPQTKSLYREYTNHGKLANGKWINFFVAGDLRVYNKVDTEHIENLYCHHVIDDEVYLVPFSNRNNPRLSNFGNMSEMYKLSAEVVEKVYVADVEEARRKLVQDSTGDQLQVEVLETKEDPDSLENNIEYRILVNTVYYTLDALKAIQDGTYNNNYSLLENLPEIEENSYQALANYMNSNPTKGDKVIGVNLGIELEPEFIVNGTDGRLYYKYNPYPLFKYKKPIYKELETGELRTLLSNGEPEEITDIAIRNLKMSDGRNLFFASIAGNNNTSKQVFLYASEDVYDEPLINLNGLFVSDSYNEYERRFTLAIEDTIYSHLSVPDEVLFHKIRRCLSAIDYQAIPAEKINEIAIFKNLIYYPVEFDHTLDKMLYRCSADIYKDNKFYYESSIVAGTFIAYGEPDRNVILRSVETEDGRTFYYSSEFEAVNFNTDVFEVYTGKDGISGIKFYNAQYLKSKNMDVIKSKLGAQALAYTGELDNKYKDSKMKGVHIINNIFDVIFDKTRPEALYYTEDRTNYKSTIERYDDPANRWYQSKFDPEVMVRYGYTDVDLLAALRIHASITMDYNRPKVMVTGNTNIAHILYAKNKIIATDFELFLNDENNNPFNITKVQTLEELNRVRFKEEGLYSVYIKNVDGHSTLNHCLSTFRDPEFTVTEVGKQINITVTTELDITTAKIAYGYQNETYFLNNGLVLPITFDEQREFNYVPTNSWYGKYTVYITLKSGRSFTHQFLLGSNFMGKSELIEDLQSSFYAIVTKYAPNELERFHSNLNIVYPLCSPLDTNEELDALLENREAVKMAELGYYNKFLTLGSFDVLEKYIDTANVLNMKINIPVDITTNASDHFIFGFVVFSENDNKPVVVFRLEEPIRKENSINMDFNLPLPIILGLPRDEYPNYLFSETNTIVTKSYLDNILTNFSDKYAYASKAVVNDLKSRLDYKLTDLDPELKTLKENVDAILGTKVEVLNYMIQVKDEVKKISEELCPEVELFARQVKNEMQNVGEGVDLAITRLRDESLAAIERATENALSRIKTIVNKEAITKEIEMQGLYNFLTIPNTDEEYHKYHFKVNFSSGRKVNFYMSMYTSILDTQTDNEMQIPYLDIRFVASNSAKFCFEEFGGPYGLTFYIVKEQTQTKVYLYFYESAEITYSGQYYLFPEINYHSARPNFAEYTRLDVGVNPTYVTVRPESI